MKNRDWKILFYQDNYYLFIIIGNKTEKIKLSSKEIELINKFEKEHSNENT